MKLRFIAGLALLLGITGCDPVFEYSYEVTNHSHDEIRVTWRHEGRDSAVTVAPNQSLLMYQTDHGIETGDGPHFESLRKTFDTLYITRLDGSPTKRNYLEDSLWEFNNGLYRAEVSNEDF